MSTFSQLRFSRARRRPIELVILILTLASSSEDSQAGLTKTQLSKSSGLHYRRIEKYLALLKRKKFVEYVPGGNHDKGGIYITTAKGEQTRLMLIEAQKLISELDLEEDRKA